MTLGTDERPLEILLVEDNPGAIVETRTSMESFLQPVIPEL